MQESSSFVAPKAVFGRTARKRTRDTDEDFTEEYPESSPLLPEYQQSMKKSKDVNSSGVSPDLPRAAEGTDPPDDMKMETSAMELSVDFLEEDGPKPTVSTSLRADVSLSKSPGGQLLSPRGAVQPLRAVNSQVNLSQSVNKSSSLRSSAAGGSKRPQSKSRAPPKKKPSTTAATRKPKSSSSPSTLKKASRQSPSSAAAAAQSSRGQKAMQSSILNFFKKPAEAVTPTQSRPLDNAKRELNFTDNASGDLVNQVVLEPSGGGDGEVSITNANAVKAPIDPNKWADEYEQLASVLDGNISKEEAQFFLEKADGNVGIALDLFYVDQNAGATTVNLSTAPAPDPRNVSLRPTVTNGNADDLNSVDSMTETVPDDEVLVPETPPVQPVVANWAVECEQLASILEGNLSKEEAHLLLEDAGGDVTAALDLFYSKQSVQEVGLPPNTVRGEPVVEPTGQMSAPDGVMDPVRSPQGREKKAGKAPTSVDSNSLDKKAMSVAVPAAKYSPIGHGKIVSFFLPHVRFWDLWCIPFNRLIDLLQQIV